MRICPHCFSAAIAPDRTRDGQRGTACAKAILFVVSLLLPSGGAFAQNVAMESAEATGIDPGAPPVSQSGNVSFYSQDLGTVLRLRYNTQSYGQDEQGNFDIGSMQVVTLDDAAAIFDGQVTMNDTNGVGFNVGAGYRWLNFPSYATDTGRVDGIALWADGMHTEAGNFFPQIGLSYESLGETWDVRSNLYVPLGPQDKVGDFKTTGITGFNGNSIAELTQAIVDSSYTVGEIELARRLGSERDAWAFAGPYFVTNDDDNSAGYRVGVRGYAYPDLLLQVAVSNDDVFNTYATFSLQWFVGRTRTNFQPAGGVPDRLREPFMRNDYVALGKGTRQGGIALTQPDGTALRVVHVDSSAAAGGDGTFENPYNELDQANGAGSQTGDIIFAHSQSTFDTSSVLQNDQRLLGEGDNLEFTVATLQEGTITIPESSPGARALARPMIVTAIGDAVTLADNNEVSNFDIDGQGTLTRAITAPVGGAGNPNLNHLSISNTVGDGIAFTPITITDTNDLDNDSNLTEMFVRGNVTIRDVVFDNIGGDDMDINSFTATDVTDPNVTLQETIVFTDVDSTNGNGAGLRLQNTHSAGTAALTNYTNGNATAGSGGGLVGEGVLRYNDIAGDLLLDNADIKNNIGFAIDFLNIATTTSVTLRNNSSYDGGAGAAGGLRADNFDGTLTASSTTFTGGTLSGVSLLGDSDGTFNFQSTVTFAGIAGTAFEINGDVAGTDSFGGDVTVAGTIVNDTGRSVSVQNITAGSANAFNGNITDTGTGILVNSNSGGSVSFIGDLAMTIDTPGATAVAVTNNTGASADFAGDVVINATGDANAFVATGGGTLSAPGTVNTISTETGRIAQITGMTIAAAGVNFSEINRTVAGATTNAVELATNTGGPILLGTVGDNAGDSGTIAGGTVDAIVITNSANATVSGLKINNTNAVSGVTITKSNTAASTVNLNDLEINDGDIGIETIGGGTGALTMTINDAAINDSTAHGMEFNNLDVGSVTVNNATIDGNNADPTAGGVLITGSNATITFDSASSIREFGGTDFEVSGGTGAITFAGDIINSTADNGGDMTGRSVHVHNVTGGSVNFTSAGSIKDDNEGLRVSTNTGGTFTFSGNNDLNTGANDAVTIDTNTGATIALTDLDIDTTTTGRGFIATGGGTLTVSGFSNTITRTAGGVADSALQIENMTIGAVDFESVNATGGENGIRLVDNTTGTVTIGDTGNVAGAGGTTTGTANAAVVATNSNVTLNGVTVTNAGDAAGENAVEILHTNATAMSANLNRLSVTNATAARDGVVVDGSGGSGTFNANVQNMTVNVTGDGFAADSGVTLTAGGTNTITSATGVGLSLTDIAISGSGANFQSVNVSAGTTNGIVMTNVTGGQVAVTGTGTTQNSGGALTTTGGDAVVLSNVTNVDLRNLQVVSAGAEGLNIDHSGAAAGAMDVTIANLNLDASTGNGINVVSANNANAFTLRMTDSDLEESVSMSHTGSGGFSLLLDNNDITTTGTDVAFTLAFSGSAQDGDVTIRNTNNFTAANATAFAFTANGTNGDIEFSMDNNTFTNNSNTAETADFVVNGGATLNSNIVNNTFTNSGTAEEFYMESDGSTTRINLNLDNNTSGGVYHLFTQNQGVPTVDFNFGVVDRDNADANNVGTVTFDPAINQFEDIPGPVEPPTVP